MVESQIGTGDLLLFARSAFQSNWLRFATTTNLEHVGLAIRCKYSPEVMKEKKLDGLYESVILPGEPYDPIKTYLYVLDQTDQEQDFDFITGEFQEGFRLADYNSRKKEYRMIAYRTLKHYNIEMFRERLRDFCNRYTNQKFLRGYHIASFWFGWEPNIENGITCTMLVSNFVKEVLHRDMYQYLSSHNFNSDDLDPATRCVNEIYDTEIITIHTKYENARDNILFPLVVMILWLLFAWFTYKYAFKK